MKEFLDLLKKLRDQLSTVAKRANDTLSKLPPLEQYEKTSPIYHGIQQCGFAVDFLSHAVQDITRELDALNPEKALKDAAADELKARIDNGDVITKEALEARMTAGELLKKEDAQAAADLAANTARQVLRTELQTVEDRRREISTKKSDTEPALLSAEVAASIPHEVLAGADYMAKAKIIAGRMKDLNDLGIDLPDSLLTAAVATPLDDAGKGIFSDRLSMVKQVANKAGKAKGSAPEPFAAGGGSDSSTGDEVAVF